MKQQVNSVVCVCECQYALVSLMPLYEFAFIRICVPIKLNMALVCYLACRCADVIGVEYISVRYSRAVCLDHR
jgi:hypothetical protein